MSQKATILRLKRRSINSDREWDKTSAHIEKQRKLIAWISSRISTSPAKNSIPQKKLKALQQISPQEREEVGKMRDENWFRNKKLNI